MGHFSLSLLIFLHFSRSISLHHLSSQLSVCLLTPHSLTSSFYSFFGTHHGLGNLLSFFPFFPHRICYHHHHRNVPLSLLFSYFLLLLLWSIVRHILFAAVDALTALSLSLFFFSASFSLVLYGCCWLNSSTENWLFALGKVLQPCATTARGRLTKLYSFNIFCSELWEKKAENYCWNWALVLTCVCVCVLGW